MQQNIKLSDIIELSNADRSKDQHFLISRKQTEIPYRITDDLVFYNLKNLTQLIFEVTDTCNLNCVYCGYGSLYEGNDKRGSKSISFDVCKQVIDFLVNIWKKHSAMSFEQGCAMSFYGGEPLLNMMLIKNIISYLEQIPDISREIRYSMTTNAVLLDKYADYLAQKKFALLISLDGDEFAHGYRVDHTGRNSFNKVFANTKSLQDKYPDYFKKYVNFSAVLHDKNEVESVFRFIKNNFQKHPQISEMSTVSIKKTKIETYNRMFRDKSNSTRGIINNPQLVKELLDAIPDVYSLIKFINTNSGNIFDNYNQLLRNTNSREIIDKTGTCSPFGRKMFVTVDGKILPCERIGHQHTLGIATDKEIDLDYKRIANYYNMCIDKFTHQCDMCYRRGNCPTCVLSIDNLDETGLVCEYFMNKAGYDRYVENQRQFLAKNPALYEIIMKKIRIN